MSYEEAASKKFRQSSIHTLLPVQYQYGGCDKRPAPRVRLGGPEGRLTPTAKLAGGHNEISQQRATPSAAASPQQQRRMRRGLDEADR